MDSEHSLDMNRIPQHIAVIMDGNGRWAKSKGYIRTLGHENGVDALRRTATRSAELGVKFLTVYAFSTENWKRPKREVDALMSILVSALKKELKTLMDNKIRLNAIGNIESLPAKCQRELNEVREHTAGNNHMTLTLALSYSSKDELVLAMRCIGEQVKNGLLSPEDINEDLVQKHLFTSGMPDPDLLIRTSGEFRISNYLLWQIAYSELYFCPKLWPDFQEDDLNKAIAEYQNRERRYGMISEQIKS
jgi:undecaprenyl diphosphate synthase